MFVFIGPQHEVIAAHSSRWPFGAELLEECKSITATLHLNEAGIRVFIAALEGPVQDVLRPIIGFAD